ncbi:uncharacterized protein LOC135353426 isoform X2 [Latimeria chalumnae]
MFFFYEDGNLSPLHRDRVLYLPLVNSSGHWRSICLNNITDEDEGIYHVIRNHKLAEVIKLKVTDVTVSPPTLAGSYTTTIADAANSGRIRHLLVAVPVVVSVPFIVLLIFLFMCMKRRRAASEVASGHRSQHGATTEGAALEAISRNDLANGGPSQYEEAGVDTLLEVETRSDMENGHLP